MNVGFLITGNEVLSGKTKDSNGSFMAALLAGVGIMPQHWLFVGDDREEILASLEFMRARGVSKIIMTGGLGPTSDDLTSELVACFFQRERTYFEEAWLHCQVMFSKFNRIAPESNKKQAFFPENSVLLPNPHGTALGFKAEEDSFCIYALPGVPSELRPMFETFVLPELTLGLPGLVSQVWQVFQLGESAMQKALDNLEKEAKIQFSELRISYQAHGRYVTYRWQTSKPLLVNG